MRQEERGDKCKGNNAATVNLIMSIYFYVRRSKSQDVLVSDCNICN